MDKFLITRRWWVKRKCVIFIYYNVDKINLNPIKKRPWLWCRNHALWKARMNHDHWLSYYRKSGKPPAWVRLTNHHIWITNCVYVINYKPGKKTMKFNWQNTNFTLSILGSNIRRFDKSKPDVWLKSTMSLAKSRNFSRKYFHSMRIEITVLNLVDMILFRVNVLTIHMLFFSYLQRSKQQRKVIFPSFLVSRLAVY